MNRLVLLAITTLIAFSSVAASPRTKKKNSKVETTEQISVSEIELKTDSIVPSVETDRIAQETTQIIADAIKDIPLDTTSKKEIVVVQESVTEQKAKVDSITTDASNYKFGYIDRELLFTMMPEYRVAMDSIAQFSKMYEDEYHTMRQEFQEKMEIFQTNQNKMTENMRMFRQQEIQELYKRIELFEQITQQDIQLMTDKMQAPIEKHIDAVIEEIGREEGFTCILRLRYYDSFTGQVKTNIPMGIDVLPLVQAKLKMR